MVVYFLFILISCGDPQISCLFFGDRHLWSTHHKKIKIKVLDSPKIRYWEHVVNILRTWRTCWEPIGNVMGTQWELRGNTLGTTKIQHHHPPPKERNLSPQVHAASHHWLQENILPTCVLCHFWGRLMAGAWTYLFINWGYLFILFHIN
jgi:hypothetical protein